MLLRACAAGLVLLAPLAAGEGRPLEFRDIIELREPSQPRISPDGTRVAFIVRRASLESNSSRGSLWLVSAREPARMLLDEQPAGAVEWTADGSALLARLPRRGKAAWWKVPVDGGAPAPLFEHGGSILTGWWSPDRSRLLFTAAEPPSAAERARRESEGLVYDENVHGIRNFTRGNWSPPGKVTLWLWTAGEKSAQPLAADFDPGSIRSASWSPDGRKLAVEYAPAQASLMTGYIGLLDIERRPLRLEPLVTSDTAKRSAQWRPDSRALVFTETGDAARYYVPRSLIRAIPLGGAVHTIEGNGPWFYLGNAQYDGSGENVLAEYDDWSRSTLYAVPAAGGPAKDLVPGTAHLSAFHLSRDRQKAACIRQTITEPPEIALADLRSGRVDVLTKLNPEFANIRMQPAAERRWRNRYGHETNGFLLLPPGFRQGTPVPLVVIQYAVSNKFTAQAQWMTSYPAQHLAAAGIAVLLHNYPRELGWAPGDFERAALSQAYNPLASLQAAVDTLVHEGIADPKRLGIAGWSFGAWLAELAITQTDLFRAASAGEGGLNNAGQYWVTGSAAMQKYLDAFFGGPPFGDASANYRKLSPALNAHRVNAPLLREYGSDVGVQSLEFYMALRRLGKPVEEIIYPGAPHVFDLPSHRRASMERNLDWFRFWLQDYADPAPRKLEQYARWRALGHN